METVAAGRASGVRKALEAARASQAAWVSTPVSDRLGVIRALRRRVAEDPSELASTVRAPWRAGLPETLTSEIQPLLDACRFLERSAAGLLATRRPGRKRRPLWLFGSELMICREPFGVVLVIGPTNYPILLPGVQTLQALVAGNAVLIKPGPGGAAAMQALARALRDSGLPDGLLYVLSEEVDCATVAIDAGVDKVVLTGSLTTGTRVLRQLAETATPSIVELSGHDAVVVRGDADLDLAVRAIVFGLTLNGGFTCIAPRRLLVQRELVTDFCDRMVVALNDRPEIELAPPVWDALRHWLDEAIGRGARLLTGDLSQAGRCRPLLLVDVPDSAEIASADLGAPVATILPIDSDDDAVDRVAACPYRLGAAIFGSVAGARALARRLDVGIVVVNDMIVPTADPRVPFGGRGRSGFGVTRGAEGLLELTAVKSVIVRHGRFRPHFDPVSPADAPLFENFLRVAHAGAWIRRWRALSGLIREGRRKQRRDRGAR